MGDEVEIRRGIALVLCEMCADARVEVGFRASADTEQRGENCGKQVFFHGPSYGCRGNGLLRNHQPGPDDAPERP